MSSPDLSVLIPAYGRFDLLRASLRSALAAAEKLPSTEIIVCDDGSPEPLQPMLAEEFPTVRVVRQANQGSIVARNHALSYATGRYVLFLDSDDTIYPEKFLRHVELMDQEPDLQMTYSDTCFAPLKNGLVDHERISVNNSYASLTSIVDFALLEHVMPHGPVYRREFVTRHLLEQPLVLPKRGYDAVGDTFIYYNLLFSGARIRHIPECLSIITQHEEARYTANWEKLAVASLLLTRDLVPAIKGRPGADEVLMPLNKSLLAMMRMLPNNFHPVFDREIERLVNALPVPPADSLGRGKFLLAARVLGIKRACHMFRRFMRPSYFAIRTMDDKELQRLMDQFQEVPAAAPRRELAAAG